MVFSCKVPGNSFKTAFLLFLALSKVISVTGPPEMDFIIPVNSLLFYNGLRSTVGRVGFLFFFVKIQQPKLGLFQSLMRISNRVIFLSIFISD